MPYAYYLELMVLGVLYTESISSMIHGILRWLQIEQRINLFNYNFAHWCIVPCGL